MMNQNQQRNPQAIRGILFALTAATAIVVATPSVAVAAPSPVVATIQLPAGDYQLTPGLGAMWALSGDEYVYSTLYRIDPATNRVTRVARLGFPGASFTVGYGSVWVTDYYASRLVRLTPDGHVQARIPVGLQPQLVHTAFGSVWTSNHHAHSLTRINPLTNRVVATIDVGADLFRDGPQDFTHDQHYLYVESSNVPHLQRVDPATNTRINLADTGFDYGGDLVWTNGPGGGTLWNQPAIDATGQILMDGYDIRGTVRITEPMPSDNTPNAIAHLGHTVFYGRNIDGDTSHAFITGVDQVSGATVITLTTPGQVGTLRAGFGDLWCVDQNIVRRINPGG